MNKLLLFFCILAHSGFAQATPRLDSLKRALAKVNKLPGGLARDTLRHQTIRAIMRGYGDVNVDSSLHYNALLTKLCEADNLRTEQTYAYQFAGYLYLVKGNYYQSIWFQYKALQSAEQLKQYARVAAAHGALAHAYNRLNDFATAQKQCQQALAVFKDHSDAYDSYVHTTILNVQGAIYREQGKFREALTVNRQMYDLAKQAGEHWYEAQGLHTIGWDYMGMGDKTKPLGYFEKAWALAHKIGSADLEESILLHIADVYIQQKNWPTALRYCEMAKQMAVNLRNSSLVAEADEKFYAIYKEIGKPEMALKAYEDYVFLRDSLSKETNQQRLDLLQAQYDNTNALQQQKVQLLQAHQARNTLWGGIAAVVLIAGLLLGSNRRLQAKNREIDRQRTLLETAREQLADINKNLEARVAQRTEELVNANQELTRKNEEIKQALFKGQTIERKRVALELHDNLSSLLSAVNMSMQAINPQNLSEAEQSVYRNVKQLIQNAYTEVRNISHNILPAELEREGLVKTLETLTDQLNQNSLLQFSLTITGLHERLPVGIELNVYSIVLELINNVIKHAKATAVRICLLRTDIELDVSVMDDGVGLNQDQDKRGIGLQNIQTRLDSLGGTFTALSPAEKGTQIRIKIPIETVHINGNLRLA